MAESSDPAQQFPNLPARIRGLARLSYNVWWSWHREARELFPALDQQAWRESDHNPLRMLALVPQQTLDNAAKDSEFLERFDAVMAEFDANIASQTGWFTSEYGSPQAPLAYFSAEYAFHHSLPLYAGGLGVLAGDYIKECSDLAIPVVAVGLIYSRGYLSQKIRDDGWQEDDEKTLDRTYDPVKLVLNGNNEPLRVQVPFFDPPVHVLVWRADIGRVPVYSARYGSGNQSALGSRHRSQTLHQRSRTALAPGNCAGNRRNVRP